MISDSLSPNFDKRPAGVTPRLLILHYTGTKTAAEALERFLDPAPADSFGRLSCHYFIDGKGKVTRLVAEENRAWHAGVSFWKGERDINGCSLGIELWNTGHAHGLEDFREEQIVALTALIADLRTRWDLPDAGILAHSDVAPERKSDPGEKFPWGRLARSGIGLVPRLTLQDKNEGSRLLKAPELFFAALARYGYDPDVEKETALRAFQRHFLPHFFGEGQERVGKIDLETAVSLASLLRQAESLATA